MPCYDIWYNSCLWVWVLLGVLLLFSVKYLNWISHFCVSFPVPLFANTISQPKFWCKFSCSFIALTKSLVLVTFVLCICCMLACVQPSWPKFVIILIWCLLYSLLNVLEKPSYLLLITSTEGTYRAASLCLRNNLSVVATNLLYVRWSATLMWWYAN